MNKPTWSDQDHSEFYPQENKPKYKVGDRIPDTNIYVRGVMTTSDGKHIYFWQIGDNSLVVCEGDIDENMLDYQKNMLTQKEHTALYFRLMTDFYSQASGIPISVVASSAAERIVSMSPEEKQVMANESLKTLLDIYAVYRLTQ